MKYNFRKCFTKYFILVGVLFFVGCNLAPKYETPKSEVPLANNIGMDITNIEPDKYFTHPAFQKVIAIALQNNKNLAVAYSNITVVRETYNIRRADLLPTINADASLTRQAAPASFASFTPRAIYRTNLTLANFELDFFGKLRNLKKSAREQYFATVDSANVVRLMLISDVASAYLQLLADKQITTQIEAALQNSFEALDIFTAKHAQGAVLLTQLEEVKLSNLALQTFLERYKKIVELDKNRLMFLMGIFGEKFDEGQIPSANFEEISFNASVISRLPSQTLLNRPDVKSAEHRLIAANANIGVARASFFPSITLTGNYGFLQRDTPNMFSSGGSWALTPNVNIPIFNAGRLSAAYRLSKVQKQQIINQYKLTIDTAFREVVDGLKSFEADASIAKLAAQSKNEQGNLCKVVSAKFNQGGESKLSAISCQIALLNAAQQHTIAKHAYLFSMINLYKVLGGGSSTPSQIMADDL